MPPNKRTTINFVIIFYNGTLSKFYFLHKHLQQLKLMEDDALVHRSSLLLQWKQAHGMAKIIWPTNSLDLNSIENLYKVVKDLLQHCPTPKNKEGMAQNMGYNIFRATPNVD